MRVYLINLDRDRDRLAFVQEQLDRLGLTWRRVEGVLGRAVPRELTRYFSSDGVTIDCPLRDGEIGCYASHLKAMRLIAETGEPGLVLEDDVRLPRQLPDILAALQSGPPDWDIVRLSNPPKRATVAVRAAGPCMLVRYSKVPNGAGAYAITPTGANKILRDGALRVRAFDEDLRRPWTTGLATLGAVPAPVKPDVLTSTLETLGGRASFGQRGGRTSEDVASVLRRVAFNVRNLGLRHWAMCLGVNGAGQIARRFGKPPADFLKG